MLKLISTLTITFLFTASKAYSLPIEQADAFTAGDNKAAFEISTGLTWLDFGVLWDQNVGQVTQKLDAEYQGWRLPTESEVKHLFLSLFANFPSRFSYPDFESAQSFTNREELSSILDIMGNTGMNHINDIDENGNVFQIEPFLSAIASFNFNDGNGGLVYILSFTDRVEDQAILFNYQTPMENDWLAPFLVKSNTTSVVEPSSVILFALGLLGLGYFRRQNTI